MDNFLAEVERTLGLSFTEDRVVAGKTFRYVSLSSDDASRQAFTLIGERCLDWAAHGTVFVGMKDGDRTHGVYAGPKVTPLEIFVDFEVGTHNDWDEQQHDQTLRTMTELFETAPFVAYFADSAGYQVRFFGPVTDEQAKQLQKQLEEVCFDAITLSLDRYGLELSEFVRKHRRLILWWD